MGMLQVETWGSFPVRKRTFGAMERGHAHAVAEAIRFLAEEVLPEAIERDHRLHAQGSMPRKGFDRPQRVNVTIHPPDPEEIRSEGYAAGFRDGRNTRG